MILIFLIFTHENSIINTFKKNIKLNLMKININS